MGVCGSKENSKVNKEIDAALYKDNKVLQSKIKLLLLGSGESGKSTIFRQVKLLYLNGFTDNERSTFRLPIFNNIVVSIRALIKAAEDFGYEIINEEAEKHLMSMDNETAIGNLSTELVQEIKALWEEEAIQEAYKRQNEFQLYDCAAYMFANIDRIADPNYIPSIEDIIKTRSKTTGVTEIDFKIKSDNFILVDVGGQRNERKKWMHCFQDVTAVVFVVALSEYDLKLYEDGVTNRMYESLKLFKEIVNSRWLVNTAMILLLNKNDLFMEKIKKIDLNYAFPEYEGGCDYDHALAFIKEKFESQTDNRQNPIYIHVTVATDTGNIRFVMESVRDIVIRTIIVNNGPS